MQKVVSKNLKKETCEVVVLLFFFFACKNFFEDGKRFRRSRYLKYAQLLNHLFAENIL